MIQAFRLWYIRNFVVLSKRDAYSLGLEHYCNLHSDEIYQYNCRSIWIDSQGRKYRVK